MNVLGSKFTYNDLDDIKNINDVKDVSLKLELTMNDSKNEDKSYLVSIIDDNNISKFYVDSGIGFDKNRNGIWVDYFYCKENNIKVGDKISFKYDGYEFSKKVLGIVYVPDHVYDVKDASQMMPNQQIEGFIKNRLGMMLLVS